MRYRRVAGEFRGNTMEWTVEVETHDSIMAVATVSAWKEPVVLGIPFYLFVPRGLKESAQKLVEDASVPVSGIYEYMFVNGLRQVL